MKLRHTLAIIFAAAVGFPLAIQGIKHADISGQNSARQLIFTKAEAFNVATERLFYHNAITQDVYHQRQGYFAACDGANREYKKTLDSRDWDKTKFERETFLATCTMPEPKL